MNEYIAKNLSLDELRAELHKYIELYNEKQGTYLIVYASAINKREIPYVSLDMDDYYAIVDQIRDLNSDVLDFYIETPGGSGEAAEEIVRHLRKKFQKINFVVSGEAKSAGTIIVLSGNEISMTETGSLGPIDAQLLIGRSVISAHDYIEWINKIHTEADEKRMLNPFDATMIAQISPGELGWVEHSLKFAKDLVEKWLVDYKFCNWEVTESTKKKVTIKMKKARAQEITSHLVNHGRWRLHGRSLKIDDMEEIGLKINRIDEDPELADIVYRIQIILRLLFSSSNMYKIYGTVNGFLAKTAVSTSEPFNETFDETEVPDAVELNVKCDGCSKVHELYAKFINDSRIDDEFRAKGLKPFPDNNVLMCECGVQTDISGIRNDIESRTGMKIEN